MPKLDVTDLEKELRSGTLRDLYVIMGIERYLLSSALKNINKTFQEKTPTGLELSKFYGNATNAEHVINSLKTIPLLGGRPFVLIEEFDKVSKTTVDTLANYLDKPVKGSVLVVVGEKIDGRSRFMQLAAKQGAVVECKALYLDKIPYWINAEVKGRGYGISQEAARFLTDMVGNDLGRIVDAIDRVILYIGKKRLIELSDVEVVVTETHQRSIFELTDAVGGRNLARSLSLLKNILDNGESPIVILNMLARHYRLLTKAKEVAGRLTDNSEVARYIGVNPYFVKNYISQSHNFSKGELRRGFSILHRVDRELKSSRINKERIIERAILEIITRVS